MENVSVIICCYNSVTRLLPTLEHLAAQKDILDDQMEIIVIDNNSNDNTAEFAKETWQNLGGKFSIRVILESKPGLSFARKKGVKESKNELIIFCDDDNWLHPEYVNNVRKLLINENIGLLGGIGIPVFEKNEPSWFKEYGRYFAVGAQGSCTENISNKKGCIYGAGMAFRKKVWAHLYSSGFQSNLTDRKGKELSSGGDTEISYALRLLGYELWYCNDLSFFHLMPESRMSDDYLHKLLYKTKESEFLLEPYLSLLKKQKIQILKLRDAFYFLRKYLLLFVLGKNENVYYKVRWENYSKFNSYSRNVLNWISSIK
jgi:glycosyltransferase involved in cell wall biosynthesis